MPLTEKQAKVLDFIQGYSKKNGYAPSQREIASEFGYRSLGTVQDFLTALESRGYLEREFYSTRNISVVARDRQVPLLGKVAAGLPIEYNFHNESIEVPTTMLRKPGEHFALKVTGDSMLNIGIVDGDYVVVRKQADANTGQIVVAMIDNEAVIKRYVKNKQKVELHSENPKYKPILIDPKADFRVLGVFVGLIRMA